MIRIRDATVDLGFISLSHINDHISTETVKYG